MVWQDWEAVVEYLMQRGEAERALPVLRRPGVSLELWYKFAPALMALAPALTVDAWMAAHPPLDPPRSVANKPIHPSFSFFSVHKKPRNLVNPKQCAYSSDTQILEAGFVPHPKSSTTMQHRWALLVEPVHL